MSVGIMMDTQGPAIRTGDLPVARPEARPKFTLTVRGEKSEELHSVDVNYEISSTTSRSATWCSSITAPST